MEEERLAPSLPSFMFGRTPQSKTLYYSRLDTAPKGLQIGAWKTTS